MKSANWIEENCGASGITIDRLSAYVALLEKWNPKINLVSQSTINTIWDRHILDSAQIWPMAPRGLNNWTDLGSGAGFPGLVCATIAAEKEPNLSFTFVESDSRKCSFLRAVARELGLRIKIDNQRIENIQNITADIVSARALATVSKLLEFTEQILAPSVTCLFLKGQGCDSEIEVAREFWKFNVEKIQSVTSNEGAILKITEVSRVRD